MDWVVELFQTARGQTVLDEAAKEFTPQQMAAIKYNLDRLAQHDGALGPTYFKKPKGSKGIWEFRISMQNVEVRLLHVQDKKKYLILKIFKHKKGGDVDHYMDVASRRLEEWRNR